MEAKTRDDTIKEYIEHHVDEAVRRVMHRILGVTSIKYKAHGTWEITTIDGDQIVLSLTDA